LPVQNILCNPKLFICTKCFSILCAASSAAWTILTLRDAYELSSGFQWFAIDEDIPHCLVVRLDDLTHPIPAQNLSP
jgi:hypothetical protein